MHMCSVACENVSALSVDGILQMHFLQAGALWHLLLFLFDYDYTLEEGGVAADGKGSGSYPRGCMNFELVGRSRANDEITPPLISCKSVLLSLK